MNTLKKTTHIYSIDDHPSFINALLIAAQYLIKFGLLSILPIIIARAAGASNHELLTFLSISLLGGCLTTLLIGLKPPFSSHCFMPSIASISYFACLLQVAHHTDIHHVLGAGVIIGLAQFASSYLLLLFKKCLNIKFAALCLFALGVWAAALGVHQLFFLANLGQLIIHQNSAGHAIQPAAILGIFSLFVMISCLFIKRLKAIAILVGMLISWVIGANLHLVPTGKLQFFQHAPWFFLPTSRPSISLSFTFHDIILFCLVDFIASLICFSVIAIITHETAISTNTPNQNKGIRANLMAGLAASITSFAGGYPASPIQGSIGDMIITRTYSRSIRYYFACFLLIAAFVPKLSLFLITIPAAANGAAIILMGGIMVMKGLQLINFANLPRLA